MEPDDIFFYRIYRVLLDERHVFPEHTKILMHWELCNKPRCRNPGCVRLSKLDAHYQQCEEEFCRVCIPVRWLVCCHKVTEANRHLRPEKFHLSHYVSADPPPSMCP